MPLDSNVTDLKLDVERFLDKDRHKISISVSCNTRCLYPWYHIWGTTSSMLKLIIIRRK